MRDIIAEAHKARYSVSEEDPKKQGIAIPQNPKIPYVSVIRSLIYQEVSAAHSERHHISEINIVYQKFRNRPGSPSTLPSIARKLALIGHVFSAPPGSMCAGH